MGSQRCDSPLRTNLIFYESYPVDNPLGLVGDDNPPLRTPASSLRYGWCHPRTRVGISDVSWQDEGPLIVLCYV